MARTHFSKFDDKLRGLALDDVEKLLAASPVIQEMAIANSDKMNIEAGFMKPQDARASYKDLFTDEYVR
jgi:hypothetical protein